MSHFVKSVYKLFFVYWGFPKPQDLDFIKDELKIYIIQSGYNYEANWKEGNTSVIVETHESNY